MFCSDPVVMALHLRLLKEAPPLLERPRAQLDVLAEAARRRETEAFTRQDWVALLSDPESLEAARLRLLRLRRSRGARHLDQDDSRAWGT